MAASLTFPDENEPPIDEEETGGGDLSRRRRGEKAAALYPRYTVATLGAKVRVVRDSHRVPHIFAKKERDAYAALGFCMAEDRLAHMDLARRAATGRLAELLGERFVRRDALVRTVGVARRAAAAAAALRGVGRETLAAFVGGVNAVLAMQGGPEEMGYPVPPWTIADCLAIELYTAWLLAAEVWPSKLALAQALSAAGLERARWVAPVRLDLEETDEERLAIWRRIDPRLGDLLEGPHVGGSVFAVAAGRGGVLSCDFRLPAGSQLAFYLAHLEAPGLSVAGAALVGLPAIVVGRNEGCAWGARGLVLDDTDLVAEELDGIGNFRTEAGWRKLVTRREIIRVHNGSDRRIEVLETRNGPLLSHMVEQLDGPRADGVRSLNVALRWGANSLGSGIAGWLSLARCSRAADVVEAAALLDRSPVALSLVVADAQGGVARIGVGTVPARGREAWLPVRGWSGEARWRGAVPLSAGATRITAAGWVAAMGEAYLDETGWAYPPHRFASPAFLFEGLDALIESEALTPARCAGVHRQLEALAFRRLLPNFQRALGHLAADEVGWMGLSDTQAMAEDGAREGRSGALALRAAILDVLLPEIFCSKRFGTLARQRHLALPALVRILESDSSPWFASREESDAAIVRALRRGRDLVQQQRSVQGGGAALSMGVASAIPDGRGSLESGSDGRPAPPSCLEPARAALDSSPGLGLRMVVDLATQYAELFIAGGQSGRAESTQLADQLTLLREGSLLAIPLGEIGSGETVELLPS